MTFRDLLKETPAFRFILDHLPIQSALGEKALYSSPFLTDIKVISKEIQSVSEIKEWFYSSVEHEKVCEWIHEIKDITGILKRLKNNEFLDDIDFFEIKKNSIYLEKINDFLFKIGILQGRFSCFCANIRASCLRWQKMFYSTLRVEEIGRINFHPGAGKLIPVLLLKK